MLFMPHHFETALSLKNVGRRFGNRWVFRHITFEVKKGECAALVGPNGSGKTTLLRVLATLLTPHEGEGTVCGASLTHAPRRARRHLGYLPATERGFFPRLTGQENLYLHGYLRGQSRSTISARLDELREIGALDEALRTPFFLASSGMRQLLHLARVAQARPGLYLLDEPTRSLDAATAPAVWTLVKRLAHDGAVVLASHSEEECRALDARIVDTRAFAERAA